MKILVSTIATIAISSTSVLAQEVTSLPISDTPIQQVVQLQSNPSNAVRHVISADRDTGIAQIAALLERSKFEEQWVFIPVLDQWVEVGFHEVATEQNSEVELDFDYMRKIAAIYDDVLIVHFHPSRYYTEGRWSGRDFSHQFPAADLIADEAVHIGYALPSTSDIVASVQLSTLLSDSNPNVEVQFAVVSPHGVVEYGLTAQGRKHVEFNIGNPRQNIVRALAAGNAFHRSLRNIEQLVSKMDNATIGDVIAALCEQEIGRYYQMAYVPNAR